MLDTKFANYTLVMVASGYISLEGFSNVTGADIGMYTSNFYLEKHSNLSSVGMGCSQS
jgi:hypothetical protein